MKYNEARELLDEGKVESINGDFKENVVMSVKVHLLSMRACLF